MRLVRNLAANIGGSTITIAAGIAFLPFYFILLGPEPYALIGFHTALTGIVAALDTSFGHIVNQFFSSTREKRLDSHFAFAAFQRGELLAIAGAVLTIVPIALLSGPIAGEYFRYKTLNQTDIQFVLILSGSSICLRWMQSYYSNVLGGLEKQVGTNAVTSIATLLQFGGGLIVLELIEPSILIFFELMLLVQLSSTLVLRHLAKRQFDRPSGQVIKVGYLTILNNKQFAAQVFGTNLMGAAISQGDKFIIGALTDMATLGIYSFCATVASLILKLAGPIFTATYPRFALFSANPERKNDLTAIYHLTCQMTSILVIPAAAILIIFPQEVVFFWTGSSELKSAVHPALPMLAAGNALNAMAQIPYALQLAHKWATLAFWQNVIAVTLLLPSAWLLTLSFGIEGAAAAWIAINAGYCFVGVGLMHQHLLRGEFLTWLRDDFLRPFAWTASVFGLAAMLDTSHLSRLETAVFLAFVGLTACISALVASRSLRTATIRVISRGN